GVSMTPSIILAATVFVTNERAGSLTVIDSATDSVIKTIPIGTRTRGMALSPDGAKLYVAVSHFHDRPSKIPDHIAVIDTRSLKIIASLPSGTDPEGIAISPDGRRVYISNEDAGTASIVDTWRRRTAPA